MSDPNEEHPDLDRRSFFRFFGKSTVQAAGQALAAADAVRRGTSAAASQLLELGVTGPQSAADRLAAGTAATGLPTLTPSSSYRSPYRVEDDTLILLDRRGLPERTLEMTLRDGRDVARAIRAGAARGAPLLGQIAAYGFAMTARRFAARPVLVRTSELDAAHATLLRAIPTAHPITAALDRLQARRGALAPDVDGTILADALRQEADSITSDAMADHAALARHGAEILGTRAAGVMVGGVAAEGADPSAIEVLLHGELGSMGTGLVATGLGSLQALAAAGHSVRGWVAEGGTGRSGCITAWELERLDLPAEVLPDAGIGWLLRQGRLRAVLVAAETVAANGDVVAPLGAASLGVLAADAGVPLYVFAPSSTRDRSAADGQGVRSGGRPATVPTTDILPAAHVTRLITAPVAMAA